MWAQSWDFMWRSVLWPIARVLRLLLLVPLIFLSFAAYGAWVDGYMLGAAGCAIAAGACAIARRKMEWL